LVRVRVIGFGLGFLRLPSPHQPRPHRNLFSPQKTRRTDIADKKTNKIQTGHTIVLIQSQKYQMKDRYGRPKKGQKQNTFSCRFFKFIAWCDIFA
jgi:hypothetical protein